MPDDSNARQLFDKLKESSDRYQLLSDLVRDEQLENEWLDYKICPMSAGGIPNFDGTKKDEAGG